MRLARRSIGSTGHVRAGAVWRGHPGPPPTANSISELGTSGTRDRAESVPFRTSRRGATRQRGHLATGPPGRLTTIAPVIPRYSRPEMTRVWSEDAKLASWLAVELAALEAWAQVGVIPAEVARSIRERATVPSPELVAEHRADHESRRRRLRGRCGGGARRGRSLVPLRPDVLRRARHRALAHDSGSRPDRARQASIGRLDAVIARAEEHRSTLTIGRTHGVHAEPTTFGLKLAGWAFQLDRDRRRRCRLPWRVSGSASCPAPSGRTRRRRRKSSASRAKHSGSSRRRARPRSSNAIVTPSF